MTSNLASPPINKVLPAATLKLRPLSCLLGSTAFTSCSVRWDVSWYLWGTPGVSKARCLGPRGRPGTLSRPRVVPGMGAMVGSPVASEEGNNDTSAVMI
jgi:hypothetical protein